MSVGAATGARRAVLGLLALVLLAGCSGSSRSDASSSTTTPSAEAGGGAGAGGDEAAFPVTIEHMLGEVTIESRPERIVALGPADADIALALGITPVAITENPSLDGGISPWQEEYDLDGIEVLPADVGGVSPEAIVRLDPDLVLATTATATEDDFDAASRFDVPILAPIRGPVQDSWQELTLAIGRAVGETEAAEALVADVEARVDGVAADLPGLADKTFVVGAANAPGIVRVVDRPTDTTARFFLALGMRLPAALEAVENTTPVGATDLSYEQIDLLEADAVFLADTGGLHDQATSLPAFESLTAVQRGTYLAYSPTVAAGLRTPTPLSIPYVLDVVRPTLEATAAADPVDG